ncbi:MAG: response regulator [Terasakiella sp.]|uniref:response regulator n=1 Tax=unclassified Terasakiella TaxID=2614952 RepID=UPI003B00222B
MKPRTNILFLDDEPAVLDGLRRQLAPFRSAWNMRFEYSPMYALENLDREPADVVVVDIKMPMISGDTIVNLLGSIPNPPGVVVLSGHGNEKELSHKITLPYEFLSKPCAPADLVRAISKALHKSAPYRLGIYEDVLEMMVAKMIKNGFLHPEELPVEYNMLKQVQNISDIFDERVEGGSHAE